MPTAQKICCPTPSGVKLTYIPPNGMFFNSFTNTIMLLSMWNGGLPNVVYGKCVQTQAAPFAYGPAYDPIDCPCCPTGYTYNSSISICWTGVFPIIAREPIPCITCNCVAVADPTCPSCGTAGAHLSFSWDFTKAHCTTTCDPQDENIPCGSIRNFLPSLYLDPIISNFRLKNKNFI